MQESFMMALLILKVPVELNTTYATKQQKQEEVNERFQKSVESKRRNHIKET